MAKILFTWEIGEGSGHIMPYIQLIDGLIEAGHEVHFALRFLHKAHGIFKDRKVIWHQAPFTLARHVNVELPINTFSKIFHHAGHDSVNGSISLITAWKNLYNLIQPDLIIFDYSPTAMLAARMYPAKTLAIGTGFHLPPGTSPMPILQKNIQQEDIDKVLAFEAKLVNNLNQALEHFELEPLAKLPDIFTCDATILRTLPELDHYPEREGANYGGIMISPEGEAPVWHAGKKKVFAYLKPFERLPEFLAMLEKQDYAVLIYGDKIKKELMDKYRHGNVRFVDKPLDMRTIGETADVAICNASHGSTAELLLAGVPLLVLPLQGEQELVSLNVVRLGVGMSAPGLHPMGIMDKLNIVLNKPEFKEAAMSFAQKYKDSDSINLTKVVHEKIDELLSA